MYSLYSPSAALPCFFVGSEFSKLGYCASRSRVRVGLPKAPRAMPRGFRWCVWSASEELLEWLLGTCGIDCYVLSLFCTMVLGWVATQLLTKDIFRDHKLAPSRKFPRVWIRTTSCTQFYYSLAVLTTATTSDVLITCWRIYLSSLKPSEHKLKGLASTVKLLKYCW